jgi:SAM-dependent methyltransferase
MSVAALSNQAWKHSGCAPTTLRECATPGLHGEVFDYLARFFPAQGGPVLDLGAGTGAWASRLLQHGFADVTAIDLNPGPFAAKASFIPGDLNQDFGRLLGEKKFLLITALEVIEHLENPAHFLRECAGLLGPGGSLVLTTPNIESMPARIKFLFQGRLRHFDRQGDSTHITPIDGFVLHRPAARAGLRVCAQVPLVRYWHDGRRSFRAVAALLAPLVKGSPYGACHLFALRQGARP